MRVLPAITVFLACAAPGAAAAPAVADGWALLGRLKATDAERVFAAAPPSREASFGRAVSLLVRQPASETQVDEARGILSSLTAGGADDNALGALYFLGRIAEYYQARPDPAEAARRFRELVDAGAGSAWAQTALTRLAVLEIYAVGLDRGPPGRIAAAERLLGLARDPAARADMEVVIADAVFFYKLPAASALPHLVAAERAGALDGPARADVLVQIGVVSELCGDSARARASYGTFLAAFPSDHRQYAVRLRLAALKK
jgi:hypothetical protein